MNNWGDFQRRNCSKQPSFVNKLGRFHFSSLDYPTRETEREDGEGRSSRSHGQGLINLHIPSKIMPWNFSVPSSSHSNWYVLIHNGQSFSLLLSFLPLSISLVIFLLNQLNLFYYMIEKYMKVCVFLEHQKEMII